MARTEFTFEELIDSLGGLTTDQLSTLNAAVVETIRSKRRVENRVAMGKIKVGEVYNIKMTVKPRYLAGQPVKLLELRQTKLKFELVNGPRGKFRNGIIIAPATLLEGF